MNETRVQDVYVDGLEGLALGYPVSKLRFVTADAHGGSPVTQIPRLTVTIPTLVLIQACNAILGSVKERRDVLREAINSQDAALLALISAGEPTASASQEKK